MADALRSAACSCRHAVSVLSLPSRPTSGRPCALSRPPCQTLNVFLDEQLNVRLGDLGVAKVCWHGEVTAGRIGAHNQIAVQNTRHAAAAATRQYQSVPNVH